MRFAALGTMLASIVFFFYERDIDKAVFMVAWTMMMLMWKWELESD